MFNIKQLTWRTFTLHVCFFCFLHHHVGWRPHTEKWHRKSFSQVVPIRDLTTIIENLQTFQPPFCFCENTRESVPLALQVLQHAAGGSAADSWGRGLQCSSWSNVWHPGSGSEHVSRIGSLPDKLAGGIDRLTRGSDRPLLVGCCSGRETLDYRAIAKATTCDQSWINLTVFVPSLWIIIPVKVYIFRINIQI